MVEDDGIDDIVRLSNILRMDDKFDSLVPKHIIWWWWGLFIFKDWYNWVNKEVDDKVEEL